MKRSSYFLIVGGLAFALGGQANAGTITYDTSSTVNINGVSTYNTSGNSMAGMQITVNFTGGTNETVTWHSGTGALGTGWSLTVDNFNVSTYPEEVSHAQWALTTTTSIDSIVIDALPGNTFFDVIYTPIDTPNSGFGWAISDSDTDFHDAGVIANFDATYSNLIDVPSYSAIGGYPWTDLYATLTLEGVGGNGPLLTSLTGGPVQMNFFADTDNTSAVPEPMSMLLFGTGLLGLGGIKLRKKTSK